MTRVESFNPRTGGSVPTEFCESTREDVENVADDAAKAAKPYAALPRSQRAHLLTTLASLVDRERDELITTADWETALGRRRLSGEIDRSIGQLAHFAEVLRDGSYLELAVDSLEDQFGSRDIRRMLVPIGPVAVFGASNFPFAFSVLGGDTVSALAAGCPIVVKAHESHPVTSQKSFDLIQLALRSVGLPSAVAGMVVGRAAGLWLVQHRAIRAVGLTGSLQAARALEEAIQHRSAPIPLFGELSSINPIVITPSALDGDTSEIAGALGEAITASGGQLCTKPGLIFVPAGFQGDDLVRHLSTIVADSPPTYLLSDGIRRSFLRGVDRLMGAGARVVGGEARRPSEGTQVHPVLLECGTPDLAAPLDEECFGPLSVIVRYGQVQTVSEVLSSLPQSLAASVFGQVDSPDTAEISQALASVAGRVVFQRPTTGVAVTWAQHHGGGFPATNSQFSSVGASSIRRWLRPQAWENYPEHLLPLELRGGNQIPVRLGGALSHAGIPRQL